jgi:hypothetical protein
MLATMIRFAVGATLAITTAFAPVVSAAQSKAPPAPVPLDSAVRSGDAVWVGLKTGDVLKGQVWAVSPSTLELRTRLPSTVTIVPG